MLGFMASRGEEYDLEPEGRLDHLEPLCSKILLKHEIGKASDINIRRGQKECPLASF